MRKVVTLRKNNRERRKLRARKNIFGTVERPRLSIFKSNKYIYAQLIDDNEGYTLVDVSNAVKELHKGKKNIEAAFEVGKLLAQRAKEKKKKGKNDVGKRPDSAYLSMFRAINQTVDNHCSRRSKDEAKKA